MSERTTERVAVVTGGTGELGKAVTVELLSRGYRMHVPWVVEEEAEELAALVGDQAADLHLLKADVTDAGQLDEFFEGVTDVGGRLDLVCNLVGGFATSAVEQTPPATWEHMVEINATSAFLTTRAAVPLLRSTGGGTVVNVASLPAVDGGGAGMSAYIASKAAVAALTRALAKELYPDRIRVNAVAPEIIDTVANREAMPEADTSRWLAPAQIARVVAFLADDAGSVVTGSVLRLRG